jgi:hypothetical protein
MDLVDPTSPLALAPAERVAAAASSAPSARPTGGAAAGAAAGAAPSSAPALGAAPVASSTLADASAEVDFSRLDLGGGPLFLERHLEFLTDVTDALLRGQSDAAAVARRAESMRRQREEWLARRVRALSLRCGLRAARRAL